MGLWDAPGLCIYAGNWQISLPLPDNFNVMNRNIAFLFFISLSMALACNNASKESDNATDSAGKTMTHEAMDHGQGGNVAVPELPLIPDGARVYFKNIKNGAMLSSPFKIEFGVENIKVDTAGPVASGSGHHHLFINATDSLAAGTIIPADSSHIHFGRGQVEYELAIKPGKYKLTLQYADGLHRSYGSRLAATINITVK